VKGRAAIEALWAGAIKQNWKNVTLTALSVERYGNAAREIGRFTLDAPDPQQKMTHIEGKYVVVWKKTESGWQLDTDIWNMNE
jgi:ketosteroid isomerase-like protein